MTNQKLPTYLKEMPEFLKPKYLIKRIKEDDIEITENQRNGILKSLESGTRFVQIGNWTLMLNSIKSIDPKFGKHNIPLRPSRTMKLTDSKEGTFEILNQDDIDSWDYWYGNKLDEYGEQLKQIDIKNSSDLYFMNFKLKVAEDNEKPQTVVNKLIKSRKELVKKYGEVKLLQ